MTISNHTGKVCARGATLKQLTTRARLYMGQPVQVKGMQVYNGSGTGLLAAYRVIKNRKQFQLIKVS